MFEDSRRDSRQTICQLRRSSLSPSRHLCGADGNSSVWLRKKSSAVCEEKSGQRSNIGVTLVTTRATHFFITNPIWNDRRHSIRTPLGSTRPFERPIVDGAWRSLSLARHHSSHSACSTSRVGFRWWSLDCRDRRLLFSRRRWPRSVSSRSKYVSTREELASIELGCLAEVESDRTWNSRPSHHQWGSTQRGTVSPSSERKDRRASSAHGKKISFTIRNVAFVSSRTFAFTSTDSSDNVTPNAYASDHGTTRWFLSVLLRRSMANQRRRNGCHSSETETLRATSTEQRTTNSTLRRAIGQDQVEKLFTNAFSLDEKRNKTVFSFFTNKHSFLSVEWVISFIFSFSFSYFYFSDFHNSESKNTKCGFWPLEIR